MPTVYFSPIGNDAPFVDSSGNPLTSGELYTYTAGSSTPEATYTTNAGSVQNANPIVLGSNGYPSSGGNVVAIWLTQGISYKFVLKNSAGTTLWTRDNVSGVNDPTAFSAAGDQWVASGHTPTYISATSFSVTGDQTSTYQAGRRIKSTNTGGTIYSTIVSSAFASVTTVTVVNDSGSLDSGLSAVSLGILTPINPSTPVAIDTYPLVSGSSDKTKKVRLEVDGLTTATTRVLTVPDADGTIALTSGTTGRLISETAYGVKNANCTMTIANPCVVTLTVTGGFMSRNMPIVFTTTGSLPTGITAGTTYYVSSVSSVSTSSLAIRISATPGGADVITTGSQSGTHTASNPAYNRATNSPSYIEIEVLGGGGGGGGVSAVAGAVASGGGGGHWSKARIPYASIASGDITLSCGGGGTAGSNAGGDGGDGESTTVAIFAGPVSVIGNPGIKGLGSTGANAPKLGGIGGTSDVTSTAASYVGFIRKGGAGGSSISTASAATSYPGYGGDSMYAGNTLPGNWGVTAAGVDANQARGWGAGGSGAAGATANVGGCGGQGLIIIREYS